MRAFKVRPGVGVVAAAAMSTSCLFAVAGCGTTNKAATTTAATSGAAPNTTASGASTPVKAATYNINLTHVAGASGSPNAAGVVVLSVKSPGDELCWNISPIKGFTVSSGTTGTSGAPPPTFATIQPTSAGTPATPGVPLGNPGPSGIAYKPVGCVHKPSVFLERLEAHPQTFYLGIFNTHSGEAVHGQI